MGFSFGELVVLALIALIVIGPKDLPKLLRTAGRTIGSIKRLVTDVRRETGLDEVLRGDFEDLTRLADHIERLDEGGDGPRKLARRAEDSAEQREREYPRIGADTYGMLAEDAPVYADLLPKLRAPEGVVAHGPVSTEEAPAS